MIALRRLLDRLVRRAGFHVARRPLDGTFDGELRRLLGLVDPDVVLDVGAHLGETGTVLRELGYRGPILSFEPDAECLGELRRRSAEDPRWSVHPVALGHTSGQALLHRMDETGLSSFLLPQTAPGGGRLRAMRLRESTRVEVRRLEAVLEERTQPGDRVLAKVDAQGSDLTVLRGAGSMRDRIRGVVLEAPLLQIYQGMPSLAEIVDQLDRWGFDMTGLAPVSRDPRGRIVEIDLFYLRRDP